MMPSLSSPKDESFKQVCDAFVREHWAGPETSAQGQTQAWNQTQVRPQDWPQIGNEPQLRNEKWRRALVDNGWSVPAWPAAYAGMEWSLAEQFYWRQLCRQAGVPPIWDPGADIVGPFLIGLLSAHRLESDPSGYDAQHLEPHLNAIRDMRTRWCVALADAHNTCELIPKNDHFILQGSVHGIDYGCEADWLLLQVPPSEGTSEAWGLVPLGQEAVWRSGPHSLDPNLCAQIGFDALPVPDVFIEPPIAQPLRSLIDIDGVGTLSGQLRAHLDVLQAAVDGNSELLADATFDAHRLAAAQIALQAYTGMELRWLDAFQRGVQPPYPVAVLKLKGDEIFDQVGHLLLDSFGYDVLLNFDEPENIAYHNEDPARKHAISDRLEEKLDHDALDSQVGMMNVEQSSRADLKRGIRRLIRHYLARVGQSDPLLRDQLITVLDSHSD